jgi:hypothetical protein
MTATTMMITSRMFTIFSLFEARTDNGITVRRFTTMSSG